MYDRSLGPIKKEAEIVYEAQFRDEAFNIEVHQVRQQDAAGSFGCVDIMRTIQSTYTAARQNVKARPPKTVHNRSRGLADRLSSSETYHLSVSNHAQALFESSLSITLITVSRGKLQWIPRRWNEEVGQTTR